MMKPDVLAMGKMSPRCMQALEERYTLHKLYEAEDKAAFLKAVGGRIKGIATNGHYGASAPLIDACPNLGIISSWGVGTDNIDLEHARRRGVPVCNTPGVLDDDVANLAITFLLTTTRNFVASDRYLREGRWRREGPPPHGRSIHGRQVGVVGMGRIGRTIAGKLGVFDCRIAYHSRTKKADAPYRFYADLEAMARDSDVLIVIVPGTPETQNMIDRSIMDALGPEGILINMARGSVVDEPALIAALQEGRLGGAGLDVFANEPEVPEALIKMDNVVLQPHLGSATVETRRAMDDLMLENLAAHFEGRPLPSPLP
jgi:lactate dehydrogenase-like 2-hydroxyacid dehydrogenase